LYFTFKKFFFSTRWVVVVFSTFEINTRLVEIFLFFPENPIIAEQMFASQHNTMKASLKFGSRNYRLCLITGRKIKIL
ncbi:hypothetical protein CWI36_3210p0010, partial [Hamiltosporidium magnivora]